MSKSIGAAEFSDGTRLFFVNNNTVGVAYRPLFATAADAAAWAWCDDESEQSIEYVEPQNAKQTEEEVELLIDLDFENDDRFWLPSRASRKAYWITGPCSREEVQAEHLPRGLYD